MEPKAPTIREKFNTYRFADHKKKVIDLRMRVTTVNVEKVRCRGRWHGKALPIDQHEDVF